MQYVLIIRAVLALLPAIIDAIKALENAFPASGQGAEKLGAIRAIVEAGYNAASDAAVTFDKLWPALQSAIGAIVSLANSTGVFKK